MTRRRGVGKAVVGFRARAALGLAAIVPLAALLLAQQAQAAIPPPTAVDFVTRSGTQLQLRGDPYRFTGVNVYNANNSSGCWYPMASGSILDDSIVALGGGGKVIRAWFFQALATSAGTRNWSGFDHTLAVLAARSKRVIVTLGNQWADCDGPNGGAGAYKDEAWYTAGYTQPDPAGTVSYRDFVAEIVTRYRDNPTILAWQLMNEAEVKPSETSTVCSAGAAQILEDFATDVSGLIKSIDPNHLVSLGTIGGGQCGAQGAEYQDVHDVATIDLCEYHDYGSPTTPMPGDQWNGLQVRLDQCNALNKPLIVGETGIRPQDVDGTLAGRAAAFDAKFDAQFDAGVVGQLVWAWNASGSLLDDFDIGPGDPVIGLLQSWHESLGPNHAPDANNELAASGGNVLLNDRDADGDPLTLISYALVNPDAGNVSLTCTPQGVCTWTPLIDLCVDTVEPGEGVWTYTVSDGRGGTDTATASVIYAVVCDPPPGADMSIVKADSADPVAAGAQLIYTLTVDNVGIADAANVVVTDTLPAGVAFVAASDGGTEAGGVVTWDLGPVTPTDPPRQLTVTVAVSVVQAADLVNAAQVSTSSPDANTANDTDGETTAIDLPSLTVNTTADTDDGACSTSHCTLREAINRANALPGTDTIRFAIAGQAPHTIQPAIDLPALTDAVVIDGTTEPDFTSCAAGPVIEIDGRNSANAALRVRGGNSTVRGLVLNRAAVKLELRQGGGNTVLCNYIGTDVTGTVALGGSLGIGLQSSNNTIGGTGPGAGNLISGNGTGIEISPFGAGSSITGTVIQGNLIGTDRTGTLDLGNNGSGIQIFGTAGGAGSVTGTQVGGTAPGAGNVVSGNGRGISLTGGSAQVLGNYVGTDVSGTQPLGNAEAGVRLEPDAQGNIVGGATAAARNVISANGLGGGTGGVSVLGGDGNQIRGNYVGTDVSGQAALGNSTGVVVWNAAASNVIDANLISGNTSGGVQITQAGATGNQLTANLIGLAADGSSALANGGPGVSVDAGAAGNTIGRAGAGNEIAHNAGPGVRVFVASSVQNRITENSIHDNGALGIDLAADGVTANDAGDADAGPNGLQNFPVLTGASVSGGATTVTGSLDSDAGGPFQLEFFANATCDGSGHGEGESFLGAVTLAGDGPFAAALPAALPTGHVVTATATDANGNTSELSGCQAAATASADVSISKADSVDPVQAGSQLTYTLTVDNAGPSDAADVVVTDTLPAGVTFVSASDGGSESGGVVTWNLGTVAAADPPRQLTLVVAVAAAQTVDLQNTADVGTSTGDPNPVNDSATEPTAVSPPQPHLVRGFKVNDLDNDNQVDPGEPRVADWPIRLYVNADGDQELDPDELASAIETTTDASGNYTFSLQPGQYLICEPRQPGWEQSPSDPPSIWGGPTACAEDPTLYPAGYTITVNGGQPTRQFAFANHQPTPPQPHLVRGFKVNDLDNDNQVDPGEPRVADWPIRLYVNADGDDRLDADELASAIETSTDASGNYSFSLQPGQYLICEPRQPGWEQSPSDPPSIWGGPTACAEDPTLYPAGYTITVNGGQPTRQFAFANHQPTPPQPHLVSGFKFNSLDQDNEVDTGEPRVPDWTIKLYVNADGDQELDADEIASAIETLTDANGDYSFSLQPGRYIVCEARQDSWEQTPSDPPSIWGGPTVCQADASVYPAGYTITVGDGEPAREFGFGNYQPTPPAADLSITKADSLDPVQAGSQLTYTLSVDNTGPADAVDVVVSDTLPDGVSFVSATDGGTESGGVVTWNLGTVLAADPPRELTLVVDVVAGQTADLVNIADISSATPDASPGNDQASETTSIENQPPLVALAAGPTSGFAPLDLQLDVSGSDVDGQVVGWVLDFGDGTAPVTNDESSESFSESIEHNYTAPGTYTAALTATDDDGAQSTVAVTIEVTAPPTADLSITKADSVDPVQAGSQLTYTLTVENAGPGDAADVVATDTLPAGVSFVSASDGGSESGGVVTWNLGTVAVADPPRQLTLVVDVARGQTADLENIVEVATSTAEPNPANDSATEATAVVPLPGTIRLRVVTDPPGQPQQFAFTGPVSGSISDGQLLEGTVEGGVYEIRGYAVPGWGFDTISCDDADSTVNPSQASASVAVAAGESVTCTFAASGRVTDLSFVHTRPVLVVDRFPCEIAGGVPVPLGLIASPRLIGVGAPGAGWGFGTYTSATGFTLPPLAPTDYDGATGTAPTGPLSAGLVAPLGVSYQTSTAIASVTGTPVDGGSASCAEWDDDDLTRWTQGPMTFHVPRVDGWYRGGQLFFSYEGEIRPKVGRGVRESGSAFCTVSNAHYATAVGGVSTGGGVCSFNPAGRAPLLEPPASGGEARGFRVADGERVSTDDGEADGAIPEQPIEVALTAATSGDVSILVHPSTQPAAGRYSMFGWTASIAAPAGSETDPLVVEFRLDPSLVPPTISLQHAEVLRNGAPVADCAPGALTWPSACITSRTILPGGDALISVRTPAASDWSFGIESIAPPGPPMMMVVPGPGSLTVSWEPPADDGGSAPSQYVVEVVGVSVREVGPGESTAFFDGLAAGRTYIVVVFAQNEAGPGTPAIASATPAPANPCAGPAPPRAIVGGAGNNTLNGTAGNDFIFDSGGTNTINGKGGNDTICTGAGNDKIDGGDGDDVIVDAGGVNTVNGGAGRDLVTTRSGNDKVEGGSGNDTLTDEGGVNTVNGGAGSDAISTGSGNDKVDGGGDGDTLVDTGGANTIAGGAGADTISTGAGADKVDGGAENDTIDAGDGNNTVTGAAGNDAITTGAGNDKVDGGAGDDTIAAGNGVNDVKGSGGDDHITTGTGNDTIDGGAGFDTCLPGGGVNTVRNCEA
jgi:uncharacterized repeat protein (TIGR01451 family)/CSLREA domain-containing protein